VEERLPAIFKPVSLLPYVNDGPGEFLSRVIEATDPMFSRGICAEWLEGRLPGPVEELSAWSEEDDAE